ncbi:hypothetical protein [Paucibacter sp. B51]|uniref:hypothetical protein n=1 Tax=Paucibacter sp. B51 TaxID=2993315 RepID=UPI0022EBB00A|nr:hypothetical protein [Paucibacter sp. B51]
MIQLLLAHGARWDERHGYGGDVMGSLLHGAAHLPQPGGDDLASLQLLLATGAPRPDAEEQEDLPEALQAWLDETEPGALAT